jgi:hypothetical protein
MLRHKQSELLRALPAESLPRVGGRAPQPSM